MTRDIRTISTLKPSLLVNTSRARTRINLDQILNRQPSPQELEFKFSALSPSYAEVPRRAVVSATLKGDDVVMLVGGSTQSRWGKGGEQVIRPIVGSFRASLFTPAKAAKAKDQGFQAGECFVKKGQIGHTRLRLARCPPLPPSLSLPAPARAC